ncbi:hypothetical protein [Streptomyces sp. SKN60]|uniref:hypothetical protein n=1 Tax=Streptomyces sp. SKN60 TaxID=2855506 RepID=UPI0022468F73|nr:hypothetical protein [Streptomyces sp. SKN60]
MHASGRGRQELGPEDPRQVGEYEITGKLGEGGMGRVYQGRSPGGRLVAVKVARAELAADEGFRARFRSEISAARQVGGFHTAQVVDADPDATPPWMVTAFVAGRDLDWGYLPGRRLWGTSPRTGRSTRARCTPWARRSPRR